MSIVDHCLVTARTSEETRRSAGFLAQSLYQEPLTIALIGELGTGKTTFAQGFAAGLGLGERVVSPSFALEHQYGQRLRHIDLYRLDGTQSADILRHSEQFHGIRLIEWADRAKKPMLHEDIRVTITESPTERGTRLIDVTFSDIPLPSREEIETWRRDVALPPHIAHHMEVVMDICVTLADSLLRRGVILRKEALITAANTHDLLRFVDFRSEHQESTPGQHALWRTFRERLPKDHESAACQFLREHGYAAIGEIVRTHRGHSMDGMKQPKTIEQRVLSYADKRVLHDKIVTLNERFEDFALRYGGGRTTLFAKAWYAEMLALERDLFPEGPPPL